MKPNAGRIGLGVAFIWLASIGAPVCAQPTNPPVAAPTAGMVHPPANVDPGIKVAPKRVTRLPTPVIRPPTQKGDTVVVPKQRGTTTSR